VFDRAPWLLTSPEKQKQHGENQKNSESSRPDKPAASAAVSACDNAARRRK